MHSKYHLLARQEFAAPRVREVGRRSMAWCYATPHRARVKRSGTPPWQQDARPTPEAGRHTPSTPVMAMEA